MNIPRENIFAVETIWNSDGSFKELDNSNGACDSKLSAFDKAKGMIDGEVYSYWRWLYRLSVI